MCGITGYLSKNNNLSHDHLSHAIENMTQSLAHRGPDNRGVWVDANDQICLGHSRLAIIDLSATGHQPMVSSSGKLVITYNGEIYNTKELRDELTQLGHQFKGHSDTEVILQACQAWGVEDTASKLIGMFVFAVWNTEKKELSLVRDRLGIKPIYWSCPGKSFLFGSELKALRLIHECPTEIDRDALSLYMRHNYIPTPYTIYKDVQKLEPGSILTFSSTGEIKIQQYWSLEQVVSNTAKDRRQNADPTDSCNELEQLLSDAVSRRMVSDVPLGAFLSGGIDSSLVTALMQSNSNTPVKTFSIGFHEQGYDEALYAKKVAAHLGTNHTELYVTPEDALNVVPSLAHMYDEPFSDSSQIPTFLISKLTREHVTVALSGDGGDEVFAGYNRYFLTQKIQRLLKVMPGFSKELFSKLLMSVPPAKWTSLFSVLPASMQLPQTGDKFHKLARLLTLEEEELYHELISHWDDTESLVLGSKEPRKKYIDSNLALTNTEKMQYIDTLTYLPDDILAKVDRASMSVSLEVRVPLLDHRVLEFAWGMNENMKIRNKSGKWALKEILKKYIPQELTDRPKMGFGVPIDSWLRGPLRTWAEDLLNYNSIREQGYLNADMVKHKWEEHISGKRNWQYHLWDVLMFQSWLNEWHKPKNMKNY